MPYACKDSSIHEKFIFDFHDAQYHGEVHRESFKLDWSRNVAANRQRFDQRVDGQVIASLQKGLSWAADGSETCTHSQMRRPKVPSYKTEEARLRHAVTTCHNIDVLFVS